MVWCNDCNRETDPVRYMDWMGDPGVINGTYHFECVECEWCGGGDLSDNAPEPDEEDECEEADLEIDRPPARSLTMPRFTTPRTRTV